MAQHKKHAVRAHERRPPTRKPKPAPMPGQHEFSPEEETAMRQGQSQINKGLPPPSMGIGADDDMGGM